MKLKFRCKYIPKDDIRFEDDFFKINNYYECYNNDHDKLIFHDEKHNTFNHFGVEEAEKFFITDKEDRLLKLKKLKEYDKRR